MMKLIQNSTKILLSSQMMIQTIIKFNLRPHKAIEKKNQKNRSTKNKKIQKKIKMKGIYRVIKMKSIKLLKMMITLVQV